MIDQTTAGKVARDGPSRRRGRRIAIGCVCTSVLALIAAIVALEVCDYWAAQRKPEVQPEAEILAAGGRPQRESLVPRLSGVLDLNLMDHGPIWRVTYWDRINHSPLTVAKMKPLAQLSALKNFTIVYCQGSDREAWKWLSKLSTLEEFTAIETDILDEDLRHLSQLPKLRRVNLWQNPNLTPKGVAIFYKTRPDLRINFPKVPEGIGPK
ncbi:MAG: hypothetical protein IAF94_22075 [Pirellulaceae bacterium]|nr:hypothetical protein [Pirellulaceae bacterium]